MPFIVSPNDHLNVEIMNIQTLARVRLIALIADEDGKNPHLL